LLLINKACTKFLFSRFDVIFQDDFQSICAPKHEEGELLFLAAVLASPLAQYLLFHTTANIGIERDVARLEEILALPFPLPEEMPSKDHCQAILEECAVLLRNLERELTKPENRLKRDSLVGKAKGKLNRLVYDYFGICDWERLLIKDTVDVFRPSSTPGSLESEKLRTARRSTPIDRKSYAETLVSTFRGWTRTREPLWARCCTAWKLELAFVTFGIGGRATEYRESEAEKQVEALLEKIRESCADSSGTIQYFRGYTFFDGKTVHLLKPLSLRHWTPTAALNDADELISCMMEDEGWRG
jgi:hypothetical protein